MVHSAKYWVPIVPFVLGTVVHNVYMYMYHKSSIKVLKGFFCCLPRGGWGKS